MSRHPRSAVPRPCRRPAALVLVAACAALAGCLGTVSLGTGGAGVRIEGKGVGVAIGRGGVSVAVRGGAGGSRPAPSRGPSPARLPPSGRSGPLLAKPLAAGRLTSRFGEPRGGRAHGGVDYAAPAGTAVFAAGDGTVETVGTSPSYGRYVRLAHGGGRTTTYAHLSAFAPGLRRGARVARGQRIGAVGSTGRSTSPHLHYEVAIGGRRVDPLGPGA